MGGVLRKMPMSCNRVIHVNSEAAIAIKRYSASALDRATIGYFLAFHDTKVDIINKQKPVVDCRVFG